jgi:TolA-binding protein
MAYKILIFNLLLLFSFRVSSQQTIYYDDPESTFRLAVQLFERQQYAAAQKGFEEFRSQFVNTESNDYVDAIYYEAVCALNLDQPDAAAKILQFNETYPASKWMPSMKFITAKSLFRQNKMKEAAEAFKAIEISALTPDEQNECAYKLGYCLLQEGQSDEALQNFRTATLTENPFRIASIYYMSHIQYLNEDYKEAAAGFSSIRNDNQFEKIIPVYEMQINYKSGNYHQIIQDGESVMRTIETRRKPEIARMIADAYYREKDYKNALIYYTLSEKAGDRFMGREDQYQSAICRYKTGSYGEAITNFQKVVTQDDALTQNAYYYLGLCYLETNQSEFARNAFLAAHKSSFDLTLSEDALFNYVKISLQHPAGIFDESLTLLGKYIDGDGNRKDEAREWIVKVYLHSKNYEAALLSLEKMKLRKAEFQDTYERLTFSLATEFFNRGEFAKAADYFSKIQTSKTNKQLAANAVFWLAESYFREKNNKVAQKYYKQFMSMPEASKLEVYPLALYGTGYTFFAQKDYALALPAFLKFMESAYINDQKIIADARLRAGDCYFITKKYKSAIETYDLVIQAKKSETDYALFQKSQCLGALGNFNEKTVVLDQLIKNNPKSGYYDDALNDLASTNLILDDKRAAIANYTKLFNERPRSEFAREALVKTGMIYYNNDQNDLAITTLKQVVEKYPASDESHEALNILLSIYMEMNKLQDYFAYVNKNGVQNESVSEQDSLAYTMATQFYEKAKYEEAKMAFDSYITNYTSGAYLLQANYFLTKCLLRDNNFDKAIVNIQYILEFQDNQYTDEILLLAAQTYYDRQQFAEAGNYYQRLYAIADQPFIKLEALEGKMKSSYFTGDYAGAIESATLLSGSANISSGQLVQAHFIAGKSLFEQKNWTEAKKELTMVTNTDKSRYGAEAKYFIAEIDFKNARYQDAKNVIFELSEKYSAFDYWVAKGFILLSDIYVIEQNTFQAKETLKSIVENYKGEDLRKIASEKLNSL